MLAKIETRRPSLQIQQLYKSFWLGNEELPVLKNINLNIEKGEFVAIVGASGSGKTTLLRIIAGLERADRGELRANGVEVNGVGLDRCMVFQEPRLLPWLSVEENIRIGLELQGEWKRDSKESLQQITQQYLKLVGLSGFSQALPKQLSGGMAQRVGIARALAVCPDILVLDEPFGALDAMTKVRMQQELQRIWLEQGVTMVMVTHDIEEAIYLADKIVVMSSGNQGTIHDVISVPMGRPRARSGQAFMALRDRLFAQFNLA